MTTTRLMARLADAGQGAGWTMPAKRVEFVDGDDVRRQPGEVVDGGKIGPGWGVATVSGRGDHQRVMAYPI